jgi:uncharacterized membrane protein
MKKLFTLIFFVGVLTSAFAQSNRHEKYGNQKNDNNYQSSNNPEDNNYGDSKSYYDNNGYDKNYQSNNRNNENGYSYNNDRDTRYRDNRGRDNWDRNNWSKDNGDEMRRNHDFNSEYGNQRKMETYSHGHNRRGSFFEIRFSRHERN